MTLSSLSKVKILIVLIQLRKTLEEYVKPGGSMEEKSGASLNGPMNLSHILYG